MFPYRKKYYRPKVTSSLNVVQRTGYCQLLTQIFNMTISEYMHVTCNDNIKQWDPIRARILTKFGRTHMQMRFKCMDFFPGKLQAKSMWLYVILWAICDPAQIKDLKLKENW